MLQKVKQKMDELHMVSSGETVLAAVSGGADSVCLLLILDELSKVDGFRLEAVHVEHGIRGEESKRDASFVEMLCQNRSIPCKTVSVDVPGFSKAKGIGIEEAARILRYQVFEEVAKEKNAKVALAHHMEDNAETILFQLARGSALNGLCGMQPKRQEENGVTYIRPLLTLHRCEIEKYLEECKQGFCVDSTNEELDYSRNYLRNVVLPELTKINAQTVAHMNATAESIAEIRDYLDEVVTCEWSNVVEEVDDKIRLNANVLLGLHKAVQKEVAYRAISKVMRTKKDISAVHVIDLLDLCENQSGKEIHLPNRVIAKKEYDKVWLFVQEEKGTEKKQIEVLKEQLEQCFKEGKCFTISLKDEKESLSIRVFEKQEKMLQIPKNSYTKWLDYDKIKQGFCIRTRQSGDYFISDVFGHRKRLKQYFIDEKVPSEGRESMWLLTQDNLVLWAIGGRISEHVKITENTHWIVELVYKGGK